VTQKRPHYFTRPDANQPKMIEALRQLGFEVYNISTLTDKQCPGDILVRGWHAGLERWLWQPFEIKTRHGRTTPEQCERADSGAVPIVREVTHVLEWYCRGGGA